MTAVARTRLRSSARANGLSTSPAEQRILLHDVSWDAYEAIGEALRDRPAYRVTYDSGDLEIMVTSAEHEEGKHLLGLLVVLLAAELGIPVKGYGSTTYQRKRLKKGLEPDECFYFQNLARVRGKKRIDLMRDPPPDLALEVEVTRSAINRMGIFAKIGVPEVWRFRRSEITVYRLHKGRYQVARRSGLFPTVAPSQLEQFIRMGQQEDDATMIRAFREWIRKEIKDA